MKIWQPLFFIFDKKVSNRQGASYTDSEGGGIMKHQARDCSAELGSVTAAMKAQRALAEAAIQSTVIKTETSSRRSGCTYGIRFSCLQERNIRTVLEAAHIPVKQWNAGD